MTIKRIPLSKALIWIFGSALVVNGVAFYLFYPTFFQKERRDPKAFITAIVQTGPESQALNTDYLAELLELSVDAPTPMKAFNVKSATQKLLDSPVIQEASVQLVSPGIVYVDYTMRHPVALLSDYENVAIDATGTLFPFTPFYSPKNLPEIYLGLEEFPGWNMPLEGEKIALVFELLDIIEAPVVCDLFNIKSIDVSNLFDPSIGKREVVLLAEDHLDQYLYPRYLRLSSKNYRQELANYLKLREALVEKERSQKATEIPTKIIDLRIPHLAFIDEKLR